MRPLLPWLIWILVVLCAVPARADSFERSPPFNRAMFAEVVSAALRFMQPRILDPVPPGQLTTWGLRGLTTLDPRLRLTDQGGTLRLDFDAADGTRSIWERTPPSPEDIPAWTAMAADLVETGWNASRVVRAAGNQGMIQTFFDEVFNHLDPYSRYEPPEEAAQDEANRNGQAGIGVRLVTLGQSVVVRHVDPDSPAADAKLQPGDHLLAIDGTDVTGMEAGTAQDMLAGPDDSDVTLLIRKRTGDERSLSLTRVIIAPDTVISRRSGALLIIRIAHFSGDTTRRLIHVVRHAIPGASAAARHGISGVVVDLRDNSGGLLRQAVAAAGVWLASGLVALTQGRDPRSSNRFEASGQDLTYGLPLAIIVDGRTASAAEILAAALADQRRAVVLGSATLGKGLVQTVGPLPDGGDLYVTWSRVLAPLGWPIQRLGLLPQVCTSLGQDATIRQLQALVAGEQPMERALRRNRTARAPLPAAESLEIRAACPAAEGRDFDLPAARFLIDHARAYAAALIAPSP